VHRLLQVVVDEGPLRQAATHGLLTPLPAGLATTDGEPVVRAVLLPGSTLGLALLVHRVVSAGVPVPAAAVRVVHRVQDHTAVSRAPALPAHAAGLAPVDVGLLGVADLADRGAAGRLDQADLTGGHAQVRVLAFAGEQLDRGAGAAAQDGAAAGLELHRVDGGADREVAQLQRVARLDVGLGAALDPVALLDALGRQDVALLAVGVVQQRDVRGAVRVVLDLRDLRRHAVLVVAAEVDHAVTALVAAAAVAGRDLAGVVAAAGLGQRAHQRLLGRGTRDLGEVGDTGTTTPGRRRLVRAHGHCYSLRPYEICPPKSSPRRPGSPATVTIACLTLLRWPQPSRVRLRLPPRFRVLTLLTSTLKICLTAILMWLLLARGSTS